MRLWLTLASWLTLWAGTYWAGRVITNEITGLITRRRDAIAAETATASEGPTGDAAAGAKDAPAGRQTLVAD